MSDDHGAGVTLMQLFYQPSHGQPLCLSARVGGLTSDVVAALIANTDRVLVVVLAFYMTVGTYLPFRTSQLYRSVTADDVVVADAVKPSFLMPLVYILCR